MACIKSVFNKLDLELEIQDLELVYGKRARREFVLLCFQYQIKTH